MRNRMELILALFSLGHAVLSAAPAAAPRAAGCRVVIVSGLAGAPVYARRFADWAKRFRAYFTGPLEVPADRVVTCAGEAASAKNLRATLRRVAAETEPGDQFVLILLGHGGAGNLVPTFFVPGSDLNARDLAEDLDRIGAENQVILNLAGGSGEFIRFLSASQRVNIAATSPGEKAEPVLAEFLLNGLESGRADGHGAPEAGTADGITTLLEAFNWATLQTAHWICRQKSTPEGWEVAGRESAAIFEKLSTGKPGEPAVRKLAHAGSRAPDDPSVPLRPPAGVIDPYWQGRRIVTEHALLEDCGKWSGIPAIGVEGYRPLAGAKAGEPGFLARRTVLGRPGRLRKE